MAKILIIKLGALGDVILSTPVVRQIKQHHAADEVHLLTSPAFTGIYRDWQGITTTAFPRKGLLAAVKTIGWIRAQKFQRVYDLQSSDRSRIYCALSAIPERVGNHPAFPYTVHPASDYDGTYHIFTRMNELLAAAGIDPARERVFLPVTEDQTQAVVHWLREHRLEDRAFVIMHAGASRRHPEKCWPCYQELAEALQAKGLVTVWIGGSEDRDRNRALAAGCGIDATSRFTINQLAGLARHARFAVTNDSGPMHAMSGSDIPVYAFFGNTNWLRNHALGQARNVITRQPEDVRGKTLSLPEYRLQNIGCDEVISRLRNDGMLD